MKHSRKRKSDSVFPLALKNTLYACILTAALVLLLAFLLRWEWIAAERLDFVNTLIKAVSACFAGVLFSKRTERGTWLWAGVSGALYMSVSFVVFAVLNGSFAFHAGMLSDVLMAFACAACTCILVAYLRERIAARRA